MTVKNWSTEMLSFSSFWKGHELISLKENNTYFLESILWPFQQKSKPRNQAPCSFFWIHVFGFLLYERDTHQIGHTFMMYWSRVAFWETALYVVICQCKFHRDCFLGNLLLSCFGKEILRKQNKRGMNHSLWTCSWTSSETAVNDKHNYQILGSRSCQFESDWAWIHM